MNEILRNRTVSGFPVSIGTSLSLETIFDPVQEVYDKEREVPPRPDLSKVNLFLFNVNTIIRNIINSITYENYLKVKNEDILDTLLEELEYLNYLFTNSGYRFIAYIDTYESVMKNYHEKIRLPNTEKQLRIFKTHSYCINYLKDKRNIHKLKSNFLNIENYLVSNFDSEIKIHESYKTHAYIFTHIPWDLLSYKNFISLTLLESHTGKVKTRSEWNTKYFPIGDLDMSFLPFNKTLLLIFGDRVMFKPESIKIRKKIYDILLNRNINPMTSDETIRIILEKN